MGRILVAGGATGIGRASVLAFAAEGHDVLLVDHNEKAAMDVAAQATGGRVDVLMIDLSHADAARQSVDRAVQLFGGLDTVFVTAAVLQSAPLDAWTEEMWDRSMALNLRLPFLLAQAAAPHLARSDNPSLLFTSSTGALRGHAGMPAYHASKAGLIGLSRSLADELGPQGIRVNCLLPGWIETPFNDPFWSHQTDARAVRDKIEAGIPLGRQGDPQDVAGAVLFLSSEAARYITGTTLTVDGGYTAV
ncbi:MAG TPA: SDR family NAD(P)-dependent oxidoreductase [Ensifer sp.]|nr:SDR family NAD(P)-dependent oxidoreductase [Ensifer sp.]